MNYSKKLKPGSFLITWGRVVLSPSAVESREFAISVFQSIGGSGISFSIVGLVGLVTTGELRIPGGPYRRSRFNLSGVM